MDLSVLLLDRLNWCLSWLDNADVALFVHHLDFAFKTVVKVDGLFFALAFLAGDLALTFFDIRNVRVEGADFAFVVGSTYSHADFWQAGYT